MSSKKYTSLNIYKSTSDFVAYLMPRLNGMRRYYKFSIGERIAGWSFDMLFAIREINKERDKGKSLDAFMDNCERIRSAIELCSSMRALPYSATVECLKMLEDINTQACKWKSYSDSRLKEKEARS